MDPYPGGEEEEERLSNVAHWACGTAWGLPRVLLGALGLNWVAATLLHFAAVQGAAMVMLPRLRVAPPVKRWPADEVAKDVLNHLVYAGAAGIAYAVLNRRSRSRS